MAIRPKPPGNDDRLIYRVARRIPFGYKLYPRNEDWLVPIALELEALDQAIEYLRTCSSRECAAWLEAKTGRKLSHTGLIKIAKQRSRRYPTKTFDRYPASETQAGSGQHTEGGASARSGEEATRSQVDPREGIQAASRTEEDAVHSNPSQA